MYPRLAWPSLVESARRPPSSDLGVVLPHKHEDLALFVAGHAEEAVQVRCRH